jgi:hypothetical protein
MCDLLVCKITYRKTPPQNAIIKNMLELPDQMQYELFLDDLFKLSRELPTPTSDAVLLAVQPHLRARLRLWWLYPRNGKTLRKTSQCTKVLVLDLRTSGLMQLSMQSETPVKC